MAKGLGSTFTALTADKSIAGRSHYSPRIPGGFTLPHCSDGTLGRGASSAHAHGQRRSRQLRLENLGFRVVWGSGPMFVTLTLERILARSADIQTFSPKAGSPSSQAIKAG